jgi:CBS domain-containing protein
VKGKTMKKCQDIMLDSVATCLQDDTVCEIAQRMLVEDIEILLVVETSQEKKLIGIITDRDIIVRVVGRGLNSLTTPVKDVMTREVITCRAEDDLDATLKIMRSHEIRRIPVTDEDDTIVGIIVQARLVKLRLWVRIEEDNRINAITVEDEFHGWSDFSERVSATLKRVAALRSLNNILLSDYDSSELSANQGS